MPNGIPMGLHRTVFCALALYHFISRHLSLYEAGLPRDETRLGKSVMSCLVCGNVCCFSRQPPARSCIATTRGQAEHCANTEKGTFVEEPH